MTNVYSKINDILFGFPDFQAWYIKQTDLDLCDPCVLEALEPPEGVRKGAEAIAQLKELADELREVNQTPTVNVLSRKQCFEYLAYSKKWGGYRFDKALTSYSTPELRGILSQLYPGGLPKNLEIRFEGVAAILKGLRVIGHDVNLKAPLPDLLKQLAAIVPDWEDHYHLLIRAYVAYETAMREAMVALRCGYDGKVKLELAQSALRSRLESLL